MAEERKFRQNFGMQCGIAGSSLPHFLVVNFRKSVNHFEKEFYHMKNLDNTSILGSLILFNKPFLIASHMPSVTRIAEILTQ